MPKPVTASAHEKKEEGEEAGESGGGGELVPAVVTFETSTRIGRHNPQDDPYTTLREACGESEHCKHFKEKLEACNERVSGKTKTDEKCWEEIVDFQHCIDHCASQKLFSHLK